ncbi:MAG TPA: DHA2 family efflux MFS transporter permease subunit [Verrucomicrobiota bacterium]|nr:DHA2 family efflux MFS transporter permease subunit [Verrucomicrobiota bacterium]
MNRTQRTTLVATGLGLFMIYLDALIVNVALPSIQGGFGVGEAGLQWVAAAYSLGMAVFIMTAATLADLQGRRRWYVIGIMAFTLASIACGIAPSLLVLNIARGVQGVAAATTTVTSLALVSAAFPDAKQKSRAIGIWTAIASVGTAIGPTLGGVLVDQFGWRSIFLVNVPVGILVVFLSLRYLTESRHDRPRRPDLLGQALFALTVGSLAYAVIGAPNEGWGSPLTLALFALTAIGGFVFVRVEQRSADPMMDLSLFRLGVYALSIGTIFVVFFSVYGMLLLTTQYLQNVRHYSAMQTGLMILPFSVALMVLSPFVGRLVGRFGVRWPILVGLAALILGLLAIIASGHGSVGFVLLGLGLAGVGGALCLTPITTLAMTSVPPERAGMASGIMSAQRAIGSTVGYAVLGSVLAARLSATLDRDLTPLLPVAAERQAVAAAIISSANPHAQAAEIAPRKPITHPDPALEEAITAVADRDFVEGIHVALWGAVGLQLVALLVGWRWFPRGDAALGEAQREEAKLASSET